MDNGVMSSNHAAGWLLVYVLGESMRNTVSKRNLLRHLESELYRDTCGFAESYPLDEQRFVRVELARREPMCAGMQLKDWVKEKIKSGWMVGSGGFCGPSGDIQEIPETGLRFASWLIDIGF